MTDSQKVSWQKILQYTKEAERSYDLVRDRERVLLMIGYTGSGKTTTLLYMSGKRLELGPGDTLILSDPPSEDDIGKIGKSHGKSETRYIAAKQIDRFLCVDAPGFKDTEGVVLEIVNLISVGEVIRLCKSIVPVIVIDYQTLKTMKGISVRELFTHVAQLFQGKCDHFLPSVQLLFTHSDTGTNEDVKLMLEDMRASRSAGNSNEFNAMADHFITAIMDGDDCVRFVKPLRVTRPTQILNAINNRIPLVNPSSIYRFNIPEDLRSKLENSLRRIQKEVSSWITSGNANKLIKYLRIFSELKTRLSMVEEVYNEINQSITEYLLNRQHEAKTRFQIITSSIGGYNEGDISNLNEFVRLLAKLEPMKQFLPTNLDSVDSLQGWVHTQLARFTISMEKENDFAMLKSISEKTAQVCEQLELPGKEKYPYQSQKCISDRLVLLQTAAQEIKFDGLEENEIKETLDKLYSLISQLSSASKTVGNCIKDVNCDEILEQCISTVNTRVINVAQCLTSKIELISNPVSPDLLRDFAFLRESGKHSRLGEYFGTNLETNWGNIKTFSIAQGKLALNQIINGIQSNSIDKIERLRELFIQLSAIKNLDVDINGEINPELMATMQAINLKVNESLKKIEDDLKRETPDYDLVRDFFQFLQRIRWLDEFAAGFNRVDAKLQDIENILKNVAERLKRRIDFCWKRGKYEDLHTHLQSAESLQQLSDVSNELSECLQINDSVIVGLEIEFTRIATECSDKQTFLTANKSFQFLNNVQPHCHQLSLHPKWENCDSILKQSLDSKVRSLIGSISAFGAEETREGFAKIGEILDEFNTLKNCNFLPDFVNSSKQSALSEVELIFVDIETEFTHAESRRQIITARKLTDRFIFARCLKTHFPDLMDRVKTMQNRLATLTSERVDKVSLLFPAQYPDAKTALLQFNQQSLEYADILNKIISHFNSQFASLRSLETNFTPVYEGLVKIMEFNDISDLFASLDQGNQVFGEIISDLNLNTKLEQLSKQLSTKLEQCIHRNSQNSNIKEADQILQDLGKMTGCTASVSLNLVDVNNKLKSSLDSLGENTYTLPTKLTYATSFEIGDAFKNLQRNQDFYGMQQKIVEFEKNFSNLVESICNHASSIPPTEGVQELELALNCVMRLPSQLQDHGKNLIVQLIEILSKKISTVKEHIMDSLDSNNLDAVVSHLNHLPASDITTRAEIKAKIDIHYRDLLSQFSKAIENLDISNIISLNGCLDNYYSKFSLGSRSSHDQSLALLKNKIYSFLSEINDFAHSNTLADGNYSEKIVDTIFKLIQLVEIDSLKFDKFQIVETLAPIEIQLRKINDSFVKGTLQYDFRSVSECLKSTRKSQPLLKLFSSCEVPDYLIQFKTSLSHVVTFSQLVLNITEYVRSLPGEAEKMWKNREFDRIERLLTAIIGNNIGLLQEYVPDCSIINSSVHSTILSLYNNEITDAQNAWNLDQMEKFNEYLVVIKKLEIVEKLLGKSGIVQISQLMNEKIDRHLQEFSKGESVEQLSQRLVDLRKISIAIPEAHTRVSSSIEKLLNLQSPSAYAKLAQKIDTLGPCGKLITEEFPHFSAHQRDLWIKKTEGQDITYAIENFRITDVSIELESHNNNAQKSKSSFKSACSFLYNLISMVPAKTENENEVQKQIRLQPFLGYYETFQKQFQKAIDNYQTNRKYLYIIKETKERFLQNLSLYLPQLLANICAVWSLKKSKVNLDSLDGENEFWLQPHPVQFLTLMRLLEAEDAASFSSQLVQVQTGEGKSVILGVLSTVFGLLGYEVSCVCYSSYLSQRDFQDFEPVFKEFGIKDQIYYSTISQMCNRILNLDGNVREFTKSFVDGTPNVQQAASRNVSQNRILLIDEVDVFFGVDFYGSCFNPATLYENVHTFELVKFIWTNRATVTLNQVLQHSDFNQLKTTFPEWEKLFESEVMKMLHDVNRVMEFQPSVKNDLIGYTIHDEISTDIAYGYATAFAYFHFNDLGDISDQSLNQHVGMYIGCGSFSYAEIPHMFKLIMGVSGTLESITDVEKTVITNYNIKRIACAPSIYGASRRDFKTSKNVNVISDKADWLLAIQQSASDKIAAKQSVLLFFNDEEILKEFSSKYGATFRIYQELTERKDHKDNIVKLSTISGTVTACTRVFARGVDFICRDDVTRASGGVHVIDTFLCGSEAEFRQLKGRSARQGDPGSFEILLLLDDLAFVEITQSKADKANGDGTLFDLLQTEKDNFHKAKVQSLIEKADNVKELHNKTISYLSILRKFTGLPAQKKNILSMIIDINAGSMVSSRSSLVYHLYFCLDDSWSMKGSAWNDLIIAVQGFISKRIELCKGAGCEPTDLVTMVNYSSTALVSARNVPILNNPEKDVNFRGGATSFKVALDAVRSEIEKIQAGFTPVLIFMSDGDSRDGEQEIQQISRDFGANGLQTFVIGFGAGCKEDKLKKMATISGGQYLFGNNGVELKSSFENISSKLSTKTMSM